MTILDNDKIIKDFIINNLETNAYYENLKHLYDFADDKDYFIKAIFDCFEMYNCRYSIYTIMDSIEHFLEQHTDITNIYKAIDHKDFDID